MTDKNADLSLQRYWHLLVDYLKPQKRMMSILGILALGSIALQLINPQIVRYFLDTAESGSGVERLLTAAGVFMGLAVIRQFVQMGVTYIGENLAWLATNNLRADLALHCLKLDMAFHKKYKPGELIERVDGDVNQLANFFSQLVVRLGGNLLLIAGVLALLWVQDWRVGLSITAVTVIGLPILNKLNKLTVPRWQVVREVEARLFGFLEEWLNGTEEIQTSGAKPYIMLRLYQALRARWQKVLAAMRMQVLVANLPLTIFVLAYVAAHLLGNSLFRTSQMTIGELYIIFYYLAVLEDPLWQLVRQVEDLQRAAASINRISKLRQQQPNILDGAGASFPVGPLEVDFDQVVFHYEDDPTTTILDDLTFTLEAGKVLGLLGRTGSGKSTLTKLLLRFHDPTSGSIRLGQDRLYGNGNRQMIDIRQARQDELRACIGMVTQDVQLFQATVRQNLTLFDDSIEDQCVIDVIHQVGLGDWLTALPDGLGTPLEAGGSGLSAGEAQLLAFGRVFLLDPGLVILDEASSRLDPATQRSIEKAVDELLEKRTGIIIAHRLATVQRADEIMILQEGKIVEHGVRRNLANDPGSLFSSLLRTGMEEALA